MGRTKMVLDSYANAILACEKQGPDLRGPATPPNGSPIEIYQKKANNHLRLTPQELSDFLRAPGALELFADLAFKLRFLSILNSLPQVEQRAILLRQGGEHLRSYFVSDEPDFFNQTLKLVDLIDSLGLPALPMPDSANQALRLDDPFTGRPLGVFKPVREEYQDWSHWAKDRLGQNSCCEAADSEKRFVEQENEIRAQILNKILGLDCTPRNGRMQTFKGRKGVFIEFLHNHQSPKDLVKCGERSTLLQQTEQSLLCNFAAFNFIVGDLDGVRKNWLVEVDSQGSNTIVGVRGVDFGNSFTLTDPNITLQGHQHGWEKLGFARGDMRGRFSLETCKKDLPNLDSAITGLKEAFLKNLKDSRLEEIHPTALERMLHRYELLVRGVASGQIKTPKDLAAYRTDRAITQKLDELRRR